MRMALEEGIADDFELQASLHDKKIKRPPKTLKIKKEDQDLFDKSAKDLQKRLKRRYLERQFSRDSNNGK